MKGYQGDAMYECHFGRALSNTI